MCQVSAYIQQDGKEELLKENVTKLEVRERGITIGTLFDGTVHIDDASLQHIDFLAGRVVLIRE